MRKSLLFIAVLFMSLSLCAQTRATFISERFDSPDMPEGWQIMNAGYDNWSISETRNAGGTANELALGWRPEFNGISRVVMPEVDLTGVSSVVVSFKHAFERYMDSSTIGIATSSDGGTTWNEAWSQEYNTSGVYEINQIITTSDFGNSEVLLCLYFNGNSYNIENWFFDDIEIFSQENLDLSLASIDMNSAMGSGDKDITFTVFNKGINEVTEITMSYQFEDMNTVEETFNVSLSSFASTQLTFAESVNLSPGNYSLTVSIEAVNGTDDDDETNNTLTKEIAIALGDTQRIPMIEYFSSSSSSACVSINAQMLSLCNNNPGKFTFTKYQMNIPGSGDPYYTDECGTRRVYYGATNAQSFMDGSDYGNESISQDEFDGAFGTPALADVRGSFNVDGNNISVKVDFMSYYDLNTAKAFVSVNEKETNNNTSTSGETSFYHTFMKFLTADTGDEINIEAGSYQHLEYTFDMSSTYVEDMNDLEVSAWLQNYGTREILNSHFMYEYTNEHPYPVQNLTIVDEEGVYCYCKNISWEAFDGSNPVGYNVYVNKELVAENTTETSYIAEYIPGDFYVVEVQALYADDKTSVKIADGGIWEGDDNIAENNANIYNIYPNPTSGKITVSGANIKEVEIYNLCGQKVLSVKGEQNVNIDMSSLISGIYMVKITDNNGKVSVNKIVFSL